MTGKKHAKKIFRAGRDPIRLSTLNDEGLREEYPFLAATAESLRYGQPWFRPPIPHFAAVLDILGEEIERILTGNRTPKTGLASAQERILKLLEREGYYRHGRQGRNV